MFGGVKTATRNWEILPISDIDEQNRTMIAKAQVIDDGVSMGFLLVAKGLGT